MLTFYRNETKYNQYSVQDYIFRFSKITKILNQEKLDGFLIILGIDSRNHIEQLKFFNWLFLGYSSIQIEEKQVLEDSFKECFFIIKSNGSLSVYIEREGYEKLKHFFFSLPFLQNFVPSQTQFEDTNQLEIIKICKFIEFIQNISSLGIILESNESTKIIEKWPLIQAYGHAELAQGFFSMNHKILNLKDRISQIYLTYDKFSLFNLAEKTAKRLINHVSQCLEIISLTEFKNKEQISSNDLNQQLKQIYEMAGFSKFIRPPKKLLPPPRFLIGNETSLDYYNNQYENLTIENLKKKKDLCFHFTIENVDPQTKLRFGRTYFLGKQVSKEVQLLPIKNSIGNIIYYEIKEIPISDFQDQIILINIYITLIISFHEILQGFSLNYQNITVQFIKEQIIKQMTSVYQNYKMKNHFSEKQLSIDLMSLNSFGEEVDIKLNQKIQFKVTHYIYFLRIQVNKILKLIILFLQLNIFYISFKGIELGSILFAESFILQQGCFLLLTKDLSYLNFWNLDNEYQISFGQIEADVPIQHIGKVKSKRIDNNKMYFINEKLFEFSIQCPTFDNVTLQIFENGLIVYNNKLGHVIFLFKDMKNIKFHLFPIKKERPLISFSIENHILMESLNFRNVYIQINKENYYKIFPLLKESLNNYQFLEVEDLPHFLDPKEQNLYENPVFGSQIINKDFFFEFIEAKQLLILNQKQTIKIHQYISIYNQKFFGKKQEQNIKNNKIKIIIINGSQGSGKTIFAERLIKLASEFNIHALLITFPLNQISSLTTKEFIFGIIKRVQEITSEKNLSQNQFFIIIQPFTINLNDVLEGFNQVQEFQNLFEIFCVITKVNLNNMYLSDQLDIVPNVLTYGIHGYSQFLILDFYNNTQKQLDEAIKLIRMTLSHVQIYQIENNIISLGMASDIFKYQSKVLNFNSEINILERAKNKIFYQFFQKQKVLFVKFKIPININKFIEIFFNNCFQKNKGYLFSRFLQSSIEKEVKIIANKDQISKDELFKEILQLKKEYMMLLKKKSNQAMKIYYIKALLINSQFIEKGIEKLSICYNYINRQNIKESVNPRISLDNKIGEIQTYKIEYSQDFKNNQDIGLLVVGENILQNLLLQHLIECVDNIQIHKEYIDKNDLIEEEILKIEMEDPYYGLNNGEYYDGKYLRDFDGNILKIHPKRNEIVEKYIAEQNIKIKQYNFQVDEEINQLIKFYDFN